MGRQYLASFPYDPLACLCVAVYYGNLLVWKNPGDLLLGDPEVSLGCAP